MLGRRRLAGAAVLAALLALQAWPVPLAAAATPDAQGYWWRLQTGAGPRLPAPPFVPAGGLWVANDNSGQQAISALRYRAPAGMEIRRLDLTVAQSSGQGALMLACSARDPWKAEEAGAWSARPATRCDVAFVRGVLSRGVWSFDVRGLGRSGSLDVVILPPPGLQETFSISFQRPDASTVVTQQLPGSPSPSTSADGSPAPRGPRASPSVLGTKTTPPGSPSASQPLPQPSPGSPSSSAGASPPLASGPPGDPAASRSAPIGIAIALAVAVLGARVAIPRRAGTRRGAA
jgi:hypothetical protein